MASEPVLSSSKSCHAAGGCGILHPQRPPFGRLRAGLGSTSVLSDGDGQQAGDRVAYLPYGGVRLGDASTLPTDYGFTGQRLEAGIGLIHYGARFYSPRLGRFVSADSIVPQPGEPQSLNRYSYVLGNPLRYSDPSGHYIFEEDPGEPYFPPPPPRATGTPIPTSALLQQPDLGTQIVELYANGDYHGVAVNVNAGYPVMLAGVGLSCIEPKVGVPMTLIGAVIAQLPFSVGASAQWDQYGDIWISPNVSAGKTLWGTPLSVDALSGYIHTDHNGPATREEAQDFLTGPAISASAGAVGGGGGTLSLTAENKLGTEAHILTWPPQFGVAFPWGLPLPIKYK